MSRATLQQPDLFGIISLIQFKEVRYRFIPIPSITCYEPRGQEFESLRAHQHRKGLLLEWK
jgi:hypothetical protein